MKGLVKEERLKRIEKFISAKEFVTIDELCEEFSVHKNTIRSDINILEEKGIIEKKYGGVSYKSYKVPTSYAERTGLNSEAKKVIGSIASAFLEEDDIIFVDSGTTVPMLFCDSKVLPEHLTIITNNLSVINYCFQKTNYNIYVLPGKGDRQLNAFTGFETIESVRAYNIQKAFIGARGISEQGDLSSASLIDARIKAVVLENSREKILMAEADKVNHPAMLNFAKMESFDVWVCDRRTEDAVQVASNANLRLLTAQGKDC